MTSSKIEYGVRFADGVVRLSGLATAEEARRYAPSWEGAEPVRRVMPVPDSAAWTPLDDPRCGPECSEMHTFVSPCEAARSVGTTSVERFVARATAAAAELVTPGLTKIMNDTADDAEDIAARAVALGDVFELLRLFEEDCESLCWYPQDSSPFLSYEGEDRAGRGPVSFAVECSDTFMWGCADSENITLPDDLASLRAAATEFPDDEWPLLWCCRKRGMRPMPRMTRDWDQAAPFTVAINACGPEREPMLGAP